MLRKKLKRPEYLLLLIGLAARNGILKSRVRLMKLAFLAQMEAPKAIESLVEKSYEFVKYLYGPFAMELFKDLDELKKSGLIEEEDEPLGPGFVRKIFIITGKGNEKLREILETVDPEVLNQLKTVINRHARKEVEELLNYVYKNYRDKLKPADEIYVIPS